VKNVAIAFWDRSASTAIKGCQRALKIGAKALYDNRKRLTIRNIAPIDIVQAEAGVETSQLDRARRGRNACGIVLKSALTGPGWTALQ
jgi:hypothetical protein